MHFIYRAVGYEGLSVFGHASSRDGLRIDERSEQPVYVDSQLPGVARVADPAAVRDYCSGPNHSGSEDPRLTRIGERLFMTYTAFDGRHPPGVALTSISVSDFLAKRWQWAAPVLISPPHEAHKNWVVFPERIGSRYAVLHAISPAIVIDLHEQLDFTDGRCIQSHYACSGRADSDDRERVKSARGISHRPSATAVTPGAIDTTVAIALAVSVLTLYSMMKIWMQAFWKPHPDAAWRPQPGARVAAAWVVTLALTPLTLLLFGLIGSTFNRQTPFAVPFTVLLLAFIMGLQNALVTKISSAQIRTTHMTGIVTDLGIELGKMLYWNGSVPGAGPQVRANPARLKLFASLLGLFTVGGIVGAAGFKHIGFIWVLPLATLLLSLSLPPLLGDLRRLGRLLEQRAAAD